MISQLNNVDKIFVCNTHINIPIIRVYAIGLVCVTLCTVYLYLCVKCGHLPRDET